MSGARAQRPKRLHETTAAHVAEWRLSRMDAGRAKYGDAHLQRYGLVDAAEELQDLSNILSLAAERIRQQWNPSSAVEWDKVFGELSEIHADIDALWYRLRAVDVLLPDALCTDEQGGERIWWGDDNE